MVEKIRVRDDDVLVKSRRYQNVFQRFCKVHDLIVNNGGIHVPAILCKTIMDFPEAIEFIRHEAIRGTMEPQLHGWDHVDYGLMSEKELDEDLSRCIVWFKTYLWRQPLIFYTPWGSNSLLIQKVAAKHGLEVVDCSRSVSARQVVSSPKIHLDCKELLIHWWDGNDNRTVRALKILGGSNEG